MADVAASLRSQLDQITSPLNLTALQTEPANGWIPSQNYRSTSEILWSCALTLIACVYTVLHLNVSSSPPKKAGFIERFKVRWVVTALFAPELMLYLALFQFLEARWLMKQLKALQRKSKTSRKDGRFCLSFPQMCNIELFVNLISDTFIYKNIATDWSIFKGSPEDKPPPPRPSWNPWTELGQQRESALYENWTERVREWQEEHQNEWKARPYDRDVFSNARPIRRLSSRGVLDLARMDEFIYVPRETIEDKSKQDTIQKMLVVIQVTWMVIQCIARKSYGLPLSLLEVHTMVHVACAVLLYGFWFKKPLDIRTPERMELFLSKDLQALMLFEVLNAESPYTVILCPVINGQCPLLRSMDSHDGSVSVKTDPDGRLLLRPTTNVDEKLLYDRKILLESGETLPSGVRFIWRASARSDSASRVSIWLSAQDCEMLTRVVSAVQRIDNQPIRAPQVFRNRISRYHSEYDPQQQNWLQRLLVGSQQDLLASPFLHGSRTFFLQLLSGRWLSTALLILLPALYGAVHFTAWLTFFPTAAEKILWRFAAGTIVVGCPCFCAMSYVHGRWLQLPSRDEFVVTSLMVLIIWLIVLAYIVARIYIVVAVLTSLRSVPIGVYWTPDWVQMLPHL